MTLKETMLASLNSQMDLAKQKASNIQNNLQAKIDAVTALSDDDLTAKMLKTVNVDRLITVAIKPEVVAAPVEATPDDV